MSGDVRFARIREEEYLFLLAVLCHPSVFPMIFYYRSEGKIFVANNGSFLEKEFLSKEVSGRKVELDEVIVPSPEFESSLSQKSVPVIPTPIREEANDDDHET